MNTELMLALNEIELLKEDIECYDLAMDDRGVPRTKGDNEYSMYGRAQLLVEKELADKEESSV